MQWPDATAGAASAAVFEARAFGFEAVTGVQVGNLATKEITGATMEVGGYVTAADVPNGLDLPCTEDPELFFAEAPQDVEAAKALCRSCRARIACLAGALERREPWGVWGGELLLRGTIVPRKRPRGRPRKSDTPDTEMAKADEQAA